MDAQPDTIREILKWSGTLPPWQGDALRRLFTAGDLTPADKAAILAAAKAAHGIETDPPAATPVPLDDSHVPQRPPAEAIPVLQSIGKLRNVNALAPDQSLRFGEKGITVVYGENATGKSGYARVLKRACRARHTEPILPNVFAGTAPVGPAEAEFSLLPRPGADQPILVTWREGGAAADVLAQLAVFDAQCARVFLDDANQVTYIPYGLDVFPKFAALLDELRAIVTAERDSLRRQEISLQDLAGDHEVGRMIVSISAATAESAVRKLSSLSPAETTELQELEQRLSAGDPAAAAAKLRRTREWLMRIYQEYGSHVATLGDDAVVRVGEARRSWRQAAEAARLASSDQFSGEPLPGVGSDPWRRLFIAAREYSIERAYVHERFPNVQPNSRCVLCMQPLDDIARDRLSRFQRFIEDKTASEAERAKRTFAELVEAIRRVPIAAPEATLIEEVRLRDETAAAEMAGFAESAAARKVALLSAIEQESDLQVPDLQGQDAVPLVRALCDRLEADARVIDAAANPTALARMTARRGELVARRALAAKLDIVLDHLRRLQTAGRLDSLAGALKSQPVSMKGRALADQAVTDALRTAFQTELRIFGAGDLVSVVDLRQTVVKGQSHHQLLLPHSTRAAGPAKVLSEGEQCVIAIASFLAELSISPVRAGIIFDDPVSSLDHRWRDKIAERLVAQAKDRQVIVFTHNIMFLYAVDRLATLGQVPLHVECLQRSTHGIGVCGPRPPWDTLNIKQRMDRLDEILQRARTAFDREPDGSEYAHLASEFFDGLRATWERCVEERLLGGVVTRFDIAVHTQALSRVVVEDQDYVDVHRGMTEASAGIRAHDAPAAEQRAPVAPDALDGCLSRLRDFVARLGKRADGVAHMRKALTKPPAATVPA